MRLLSYILFCHFLFATCALNAQAFNSYSFNELYDFEIETVYDIYQDEGANIWLGTNEGLVKFNGVDFTYFSHKKYGKAVTEIQQGKDGRMWCSNFGGQLFFVENGVLNVAIEKCADTQFADVDFIDKYFVGENEIVYSTSRGEVYRFDAASLSSSSIKKENEGRVVASAIKGEELIWASFTKTANNETGIEISSYDCKTKKQKTIASGNLSIVSSKNGLVVDGDDLYFWRSNTNLECYKIEDGQVKIIFIREGVNTNSVNEVQVNQGKVEVETKSGIYWFNQQGESMMPERIFATSSVSKTFYDREENWWICTLNEGVKIVQNQQLMNSELSNLEIVYTCSGDDGDLYFMDVTGTFYSLKAPYLELDVIGKKDLSTAVKMVYNPFDKNIYFNSSTYSYNTVSEVFQPLSFKKSSQSQLSFRNALFIDEGNIIVSGYGRTFIFNLQEESIQHLVEEYKSTSLSPSYHLNLKNQNSDQAVVEENGEYTYLNYRDGLFYYGEGKAEYVLWKGEKVLATKLLQADDLGIWAGTRDQHILKIEKGVVTSSYLLPESVTGIVQWHDILFLSSKKRLFKLNTKTSGYMLLDATDGLLEEKIVGLYLQSDTLIVLGTHHLQKIPCSFESENTMAPVLRIESLLLFEQRVNGPDYYFEHDENAITINFSATAIRSQGRCLYKYRLNSGDWIETTADAPFARFSQLAAGSYVFEVVAINEDGVSSTTETVRFFIDDHFTRKWWFLTLVFVLVLLILIAVVRYRLRRFKEQNALETEQQHLKKEVYKSKITALRAQMNPHFMFNALNTIQEFIITNQKEVAGEYLADFADLMRKYLDQSKQDEIKLSEEIETLEIYLGLENLRSDGVLKYTINCEPTLNPYEISIPVMLLQPFIENSIKHGLLHKSGDKRLGITFRMKGESRLECRIEDNGVGRQASAEINKARKFEHTSFATKAVDQKIELVNEGSSRNLKITVEDLQEGDVPSGTVVLVEIDI